MHTCNPAARSASRSPARTAARLSAWTLLALVLAACSDSGAPVTGPASGARPAAPPLDGPTLSAGVATCNLAVRQFTGGYRAKTLAIAVPGGIQDPAGRTVKFGYRQWARGLPDPVRMVQCLIPATPAASAWFNDFFSGGDAFPAGSSRGVALSMQAAAAVESRAYTTEPVMVYDETVDMVAPCEPYELQTIDGGSCGGEEEGGGEWEGPPPVEEEPGESEAVIAPDPTAPAIDADVDAGVDAETGGAAAAVTIICSGATDSPHRSTHAPGMVNVIGRTSCSAPISISVSVSLQRQSCWGWFCWWSTRGSGYYAAVATLARTNAAAPCQTGYWRGYSVHTARPPLGYWPPYASWASSRTAQITFC